MLRLVCALILLVGPAAAQDYVPGPHPDWEHRDPAEMGLDPVKLQAAIDFAVAHETRHPPELAAVADVRDLRITVPLTWAREAFSSPIGPLEPRAAPNGIILKDGYIVAQWGEVDEVDMTFSISKTFLCHTAGLAFDRGFLDPDKPVIEKVTPTEDFALPHNAPITWDMMLRQTSGWIGTLWGKPWWADRPGETASSDLIEGPPEPGRYYEYNDVRVNALALALTHLWEQSLPEVLEEGVMSPIGASDSWHWEGYDNSWTDVYGNRLKVVSGGGHWGGGMFINAYDLARLGLLGLREGQWGEEVILSTEWIARARTPTGPESGYGYMNWFLNTDQKRFPAAREDAVSYLGAGANMVYIDYEHDLVAVVRWIDSKQLAAFVELLLEAAEE
ncbi:serine hydrolase domain-containing protein [Parvularcula marina]|nr:serine hydrolase [Parvularcula marina]